MKYRYKLMKQMISFTAEKMSKFPVASQAYPSVNLIWNYKEARLGLFITVGCTVKREQSRKTGLPHIVTHL